MKLVEVAAKEAYRMYVRYDDGESGIVDLSDLTGRGVFTAWTKPGVFQQVRLADGGYPEWPGGLDLCPDELYIRLTGKEPGEVFRKAQALEAPGQIAPLD